MDEMDIDMEIDLQIDPEAEAHTETVANTANPFATTTSVDASIAPIPNHMADMNIMEEGAEPVAEKVHVRGLDNFSTDDVKAIALEHYPQDFVRVEWIDDTSANLIYASAEAGSQALAAITAEYSDPTAAASSIVTTTDIPELQLRPAKKLSTHALTNLYVRQATTSDVKQKNAHQASRYYLFHGDPRERKQQGGSRGEGRRGGGPRGQRRGSNDEDGSEYSRRRFDDRELKRRRDAEGFDASMYDEGEGGETTGVSDADDLFSSASRKKARFGGGGGAQRRRAAEGDDLFANQNGGQGRMSGGSRLRDRSASPSRGEDGRLGFGSDSDAVFRKRARARSRTPPRYNRTRGGNQTEAAAAANRELFPSAAALAPSIDLMDTLSTRPSSTLLNSNPTNPFPAQKELFPVKHSLSPKKELFPGSTTAGNGNGNSNSNSNGGGGRSHHRRSGAVDASPRNSTFDLLSTGNGLNGFAAESPTQNDRSSSGRMSSNNASKQGQGLSLADRISRGSGDSLSIKGSALSATAVGGRQREDLNILGASGFSVRGAAAPPQSLPTARELFPSIRAGGGGGGGGGGGTGSINAGKELFGGKIQGRERVRRRAEEFY